MSTTVFIPTPLRPFTDQQATVQVGGSSVGEVLQSLVTVHPELRNHLFNADGKLRSFVNVYVNDEDIRYLSKEQTPVGEKDTVSIVPSVAGGSPAADLDLNNDEVRRYSRHLIMPEVGMEGQLKLKQAQVLLVGTGGLGAPLHDAHGDSGPLAVGERAECDQGGECYDGLSHAVSPSGVRAFWRQCQRAVARRGSPGSAEYRYATGVPSIRVAAIVVARVLHTRPEVP